MQIVKVLKLWVQVWFEVGKSQTFEIGKSWWKKQVTINAEAI